MEDRSGRPSLIPESHLDVEYSIDSPRLRATATLA